MKKDVVYKRILPLLLAFAMLFQSSGFTTLVYGAEFDNPVSTEIQETSEVVVPAPVEEPKVTAEISQPSDPAPAPVETAPAVEEKTQIPEAGAADTPAASEADTPEASVPDAPPAEEPR